MLDLSNAKRVIASRKETAENSHAEFLRTLRENADFRKAEAVLSEARWEQAIKNGDKEKKALAEAEKAFEARVKDLGYTLSDLEPKRVCKKCEDTGAYDGKICDCVKALAVELAEKENPLIKNAPAWDKIDFAYYNKNADFYKKTASGIAAHFFNGDRSTLVIFGGTGTGKTYIASCAAKKLLHDGRSIFTCTAPELSKLFLQYTVAPLEAKESVWSPLESDVVYIDDLGCEQIYNNVTAPLLYTLVSERLGKKTIITSNLSLRDMELKYGQRICSRLFDKKNSIVLQFEGSDLRL